MAVTGLTQHGEEAVIRMSIWGFIGTLYGILFVSFLVLARHWHAPVPPLLVAGTLAGTFSALIYGSMRLAVVTAIVATVVCILFFVWSPDHVRLGWLLLVVAAAGAVTGALYGALSSTSRVFRADAKSLAGIAAGLAVSLALVLLDLLAGGMPVGLTVSILCPLTGWLYVYIVPGFIKRFDDVLPPPGDGAIVAVGTSVFVAICFFVMVSGVMPEIAGPLLGVTERIQELLPQAIGGGLVGGAVAGLLSVFMFRNWQDL